MLRAVELAARYRGRTRPNPPVGAVIVKNGRIVAEGCHRKCGSAHAEADAIAKARCDLSGAEMYVTLEPCSRQGRVGPCTEAIIKSGIKRVVYAWPDPNPANRSRAARIFSRAGVECECWKRSRVREERQAARTAFDELLRPFAKHVTTGLPFVTVKLAMTLDGRICDVDGNSRWISSPGMRALTGSWRESYDVVMVGGGTVRADNPSLLCHTKRNDCLWRAVVSKTRSLPPSSKIFTDEARHRTLVYTDAVEAVKDLGRRGFMSVLCEGGLSLARSLAEAGLVDEWCGILAPVVFASRPISKAIRFGSSVHIVRGDDVMLKCAGIKA